MCRILSKSTINKTQVATIHFLVDQIKPKMHEIFLNLESVIKSGPLNLRIFQCHAMHSKKGEKT